MTILIKAFLRGHFADKPLCSLKVFHGIEFLQDNLRTNRSESCISDVSYRGEEPHCFSEVFISSEVGISPRPPILLVNIMFSLRLRTTGTYLDIFFQIHVFFYFLSKFGGTQFFLQMLSLRFKTPGKFLEEKNDRGCVPAPPDQPHPNICFSILCYF